LFIRLRDILLDQEILKIIDSKECLLDLSVGDIVEFQGLALPNPTYQIRHSFGQILPIIEPFAKLTETQLDQQLAQIKNPTLKGGVCYGPHYGPQSRFSWIQKSSNLRCPGFLDLHD
jgi:hypothetical protein